MISFLKGFFKKKDKPSVLKCCHKARPGADDVRLWICFECQRILGVDDAGVVTHRKTAQTLSAMVEDNMAFVITDREGSKRVIQLAWETEPTEEHMTSLGQMLKAAGLVNGLVTDGEGFDQTLNDSLLTGLGYSTKIH